MRAGWHFAGRETLGMSVVRKPESPFYGAAPVPRMVENQLNHAIEVYMVQLEKDILHWLETSTNENWVYQFLAIFFVLHVREVDAGRNLYWARNLDPVCPALSFIP